MIVYLARNKVNGKCYVGQTVKPLTVRIREHYNALQTGLGFAMRKYGKAAFDFSVLQECQSPEELNDAERYWIAVYGSHSRSGYNRTDGGDGLLGHPHSEATKQKMREAALGERNHNFGIPRSPEENAKRSASLKGKMVGDKNPMYGKRFARSEETRKRMRESFNRPEMIAVRRERMLGDGNPSRNPTTRAVISASVKASWENPERREKQRIALIAWHCQRRIQVNA